MATPSTPRVQLKLSVAAGESVDVVDALANSLDWIVPEDFRMRLEGPATLTIELPAAEGPDLPDSDA